MGKEGEDGEVEESDGHKRKEVGFGWVRGFLGGGHVVRDG